jgi:hypothetical protein
LRFCISFPKHKSFLSKICDFWKDRRTSEVVNFTHEQKPWKTCRDGEYIPYSLIIQEGLSRVYAPVGGGLPKNKGEQAFIKQTLEGKFQDCLALSR